MTELFVRDAMPVSVRSGRRIFIANLAFRKRGKRGEKDETGWEGGETHAAQSQNGKTVAAQHSSL